MSAVLCVRFAFGPEPRWRLSFNFFRDGRPKPARGVHVKLRRFGVFRHFLVKFRYGSAFGRSSARRELWIAWFESREGVRGLVNGWRYRIQVDRMRDFKPTKNSEIPVYPSQPRSTDREFEVR